MASAVHLTSEQNCTRSHDKWNRGFVCAFDRTLKLLKAKCKCNLVKFFAY